MGGGVRRRPGERVGDVAVGSEPVIVEPAPSLSTKPVANSVTIGQPLQDTAHVSGGLNPNGNVTFERFSSKDCSGSPVFTSTNPHGNEPGSDAHSSQSDPYTATAAGDYQWVAVYNGDAGNPSAMSRCGAEPVTVNRAQPTISTKVVESSVVIGNTVQDGATISGGKSPTGNVSLELFKTQDCSGSPVFTTTDPLTSKQGSSSETTESDPFTPLKPGTYQWVATYTGDGANAPASSPCGSETAIVTPQSTRDEAGDSRSAQPRKTARSRCEPSRRRPDGRGLKQQSAWCCPPRGPKCQRACRRAGGCQSRALGRPCLIATSTAVCV